MEGMRPSEGNNGVGIHERRKRPRKKRQELGTKQQLLLK